MGAVEKYCHRAMLIHDGDRVSLGEPGERCPRVPPPELPGSRRQPGMAGEMLPDRNSRLLDAWIENASGERITNLETGETIRFSADPRGARELPDPVLRHPRPQRGRSAPLRHQPDASVAEGEANYVAPGQRIRISAEIENLLTPGRYFVSCWVVRGRESGQLALQAIEALDFVVFGMAGTPAS